MTFMNLKSRFLLGGALICAAVPSYADSVTTFAPGNLLLSRSVYAGDATTVTVGQALPPNCPSTAKCPTVGATNDGTYPNVFLNNTVDGSFGITSPIYIDQVTTGGSLLSTYAVPTSTVVTSFSSKSELALNLSTDGKYVTFMGYNTSPNSLDVSNSNTPGVVDPTNPVGANVYREVAQLDANGALTTTNTNAYSGNNGRAAIYAADSGYYYTVGNNNNGAGTATNLVTSTGVEIIPPGTVLTAPQQVGNFSITQYGYPADKAGKDNNFRGLTIFNDTVYVTKGSGGNGINTVYQVGAPGTLPTLGTAGSSPIIVLNGFPTTLAKDAGARNPFGLYFASATTLYVADEGDGTTATAATNPYSGLEKWTYNGSTWTLAYVLQNGLNLGQQYSVPSYPAALNPATDGLRNITGRVNSDGTVTIWATTSTISASGDQGADPNKLVTVTDVLANTDPLVAGAEQFQDVRAAGYGEVLRGVSFTPGTTAPAAPGRYPVLESGLAYNRRTHAFTGSITIRNNTNATVNVPLYVEFSSLSAGVTLMNGIVKDGLPAIQVLGSGATLAPGATASAAVVFTNPSNAPISYSTSVTF